MMTDRHSEDLHVQSPLFFLRNLAKIELEYAAEKEQFSRH